jgi:hypothetical protein
MGTDTELLGTSHQTERKESGLSRCHRSLVGRAWSPHGVLFRPVRRSEAGPDAEALSRNPGRGCTKAPRDIQRPWRFHLVRTPGVDDACTRCWHCRCHPRGLDLFQTANPGVTDTVLYRPCSGRCQLMRKVQGFVEILVHLSRRSRLTLRRIADDKPTYRY